MLRRLAQWPIAGAIALLFAAGAIALLESRGVRSGANAVACLAAGAVVATLACEAIEVGNFPPHSLAAGFWLLLAGACVAALAALANAVCVQRELRRELTGASGGEAE